MINDEERGDRDKDLELRLQNFIDQLSARNGVLSPTVKIVPLEHWVQVASETVEWEDVLAHYSPGMETIYLRSDRAHVLGNTQKEILHEFAHHLLHQGVSFYGRTLDDIVEFGIEDNLPKHDIEVLNELMTEGLTKKMREDDQIQHDFDEKVVNKWRKS